MNGIWEQGKKEGGKREGRKGKRGKEMQVQYIFPAIPRTLKENQLVPYNNDLSPFSANRCVLPLASPFATVSNMHFYTEELQAGWIVIGFISY